MYIINEIKKILGLYPKGPNEFVEKFVKESKHGRTQLQLIYNNNIIVQVDPLKFAPSWFKIAGNVDKKKYKNGYVAFFILDKFEIENNEIYQKYKKSDELQMIEIEEFHGETKVITFANFLDENVNYMDLSICLRKIIDETHSFKEKNPNINFNIRYLNNHPG